MGSMAVLNIGSKSSYEFMSYKNTFGDLLMLFTMDDLQIKEVDEDGEIYTRRYFSTSVKKAKQCLDILGFTTQKAQETFEKSKQEKLDFLEEYSVEDELINYKDQYTFENWTDAVHKYARILSNDIFNSKCEYTNLEKSRSEQKNISEKEVCDSLPYGDSSYWGISHEYASWEIFRVILEAFDNEDEVIVDYTDLYDGGWCDEKPEEELFDVPKTIVLTEGKYDVEVIKESLELLYPYMSKFYSFMDFSTFNVQGSTNFLTHYLKAFISARIENKIIALYDNDSAGLAEIESLKTIKIPQNVRVMHLPDIDIAKHYPTKGPTGDEDANINGRACSIELYLGIDILQEDKEFMPVKWTGYIDKVQSYQGEIFDKQMVQKKFNEKVKRAKKEGISDLDNWKEMIRLLNSIFEAFM